MENINIKSMDFEIPSDVLEQIQQNIEDIIRNFDIPDANKTDVIKKINFMYSSTIHMSVTDPLTKLYNRRHFESNFEREYMRAKRYNSPLSLAIVDIFLKSLMIQTVIPAEIMYCASLHITCFKISDRQIWFSDTEERSLQ